MKASKIAKFKCESSMAKKVLALKSYVLNYEVIRKLD